MARLNPTTLPEQINRQAQKLKPDTQTEIPKL